MDSTAVSDGHRVLYRECILAPTKVLASDPCPLGLPEILTGAHIDGAPDVIVPTPKSQN